MKILYLLKNGPEATVKVILDEHEKSDAVTVIDIRSYHDYDRMVELIVSSDMVISW